MEDYGCKFGLPHDMHVLSDTRVAKWEVCQICGRKFRWTKGFKGRINNVAYLKAHARNYAQQSGPTKRLYMRLYQPEKCIISL